jgi:hypothetical protein
VEFLSIILRLIAAWGIGFVLQGERGDRGGRGGPWETRRIVHV